MEIIFKQLAKVDILDIYEEIAEIPISDEQVVKMCLTIPCKVDLRQVNLVHLVEQKYKQKLSTYKKSKMLKWLKVNLPRLIPDPEAKYLRWRERHLRNVKIDWIIRKAQAVQQLPPPISCSSDSELEHGESTSNVLVNDTQPMDSLARHSTPTTMQQLPPSSITVSSGSKRERVESSSDIFVNETQISDSITPSTAETFETVIPSQPKSTQEILPGFSDLMEASKSSLDSFELPTPFSNSVSSTQGIDGESPSNQNRVEKNQKLLPKVLLKKRTLQQSEEFSSQDDPYSSFSLDNMVTSTQEFG